jgi:hypothetical protein
MLKYKGEVGRSVVVVVVVGTKGGSMQHPERLPLYLAILGDLTEAVLQVDE